MASAVQSVAVTLFALAAVGGKLLADLLLQVAQHVFPRDATGARDLDALDALPLGLFGGASGAAPPGVTPAAGPLSG